METKYSTDLEKRDEQAKKHVMGIIIAVLVALILLSFIGSGHSDNFIGGYNDFPYLKNLFHENTSDSLQFDYEDGGTKIVSEVDSLRAPAQIELGDDKVKWTYNSTLEALVTQVSGTGTMIDQWPNYSSGWATGTIYASDTVYVAGWTDLADSLGFWQVCISNPANRKQTQVFTVASVNAAWFELGSSWTGDDITNAQVTPYGATYFRFLASLPYLIYDRADSSFAYTLNDKRY